MLALKSGALLSLDANLPLLTVMMEMSVLLILVMRLLVVSMLT
jgi:hypothetical protein